MSEAVKQQPVPEDETFLSDEDMFEKAYKEKHGIQNEQAEPDASTAEAAPKRGEDDGESEEPELLDGESAERGDEEDVAEDETPAWMKDLPEEAVAALEQREKELAALRNQYNAVHNRLAPVQQENARLRQRLSEQAPSPAQGANSGRSPVGQSQPTAEFSLDDVEEFKEFREAFPDEAKAMEAAFARQHQQFIDLRSQLDEMRGYVQETRQTSIQSARERELARLQEAHPDWATVRPSEDFEDWLQHQPESVASLASSSKADDCIWVLDRYKMDVYLAQQHQQGDSAEPVGDSRAQQTRERRQKLRSVPNPRPQQDGGVGAPQMGGVPMSEEEIWEQEVKRRLRAQREANR